MRIFQINTELKIGIVTVVLNASQTILQTIESVRKQNYQNFIHLIIDGGSDDGTLSIIEENYHSKLLLFERPQVGIYQSMNIGIEYLMNKVDVINFLNADDYLMNEEIFSRVAQNIKINSVVMNSVSVVESKNTNRAIRVFEPVSSQVLLALSVCSPHPGFYASTYILKKMKNPFFDPKAGAGADIVWMKSVIKGAKSLMTTKEIAVVMRDGGVSNSGFINKVMIHIKLCRYLYGKFWLIVFPVIFIVKQFRTIRQKNKAHKLNILSQRYLKNY